MRNKTIPYQQADVEDLHNTIFVKLFEHHCKKLKQFEGKNGCSLFSWIRLITIRTVLGHIRKIRKDAVADKEKILPLDEVMNLRQESPGPISAMEKAEQYQLIEQGMLSLLPRYRLFLQLHFYKDLSIRETADIMGISEVNAHSVKHRAIKQLQTVIAQNTG